MSKIFSLDSSEANRDIPLCILILDQRKNMRD